METDPRWYPCSTLGNPCQPMLLVSMYFKLKKRNCDSMFYTYVEAFHNLWRITKCLLKRQKFNTPRDCLIT